ncbi:MAG TPA: triose-phosphate isomerase [Bacteroides sp.]|nr:triose-phosphate isomerase [Bacteroides sp.]
MRKLIVAGNWKMNMTLQDGIKLAAEVNEFFKKNPTEVEVIIAPSYIHLPDVGRSLSSISLSAQNSASESAGAFTGEVSAEMIKSTGAQYVILGHSERRTYYGEDDNLLRRKIILVLEQGLKPIFCCGEILAEREAGNHFNVVKNQVETSLFDLSADELDNVVIAYEPVWAIGTGVTASPDQAQEMHAYIREIIRAKFEETAAENMTILYGGSCKPSNARELFKNPDVDGGLIGGAALKADDFIAIIQSF